MGADTLKVTVLSSAILNRLKVCDLGKVGLLKEILLCLPEPSFNAISRSVVTRVVVVVAVVVAYVDCWPLRDIDGFR